MAKQLNVNLAFSADTGKVKMQLQDLQNQLQKLTLSSKIDLGVSQDIEKASKAAAELSAHLKNATNQQTGTLDFAKLNQSIKQSGTSLQQYGRTLQSLGPQGQQAFMSLAQAVANSEVPIRRTNALIKEMGTTLANTVRWQLSSSMLHGFMGAVQSAYGYAQDLNESLNNIRIVTGQNIDQMAKFAEQANKAARALSTTTTEYTNASLIYYQQGLNDKQVKERTDITVKMANVARQSAEVVADQMTAVWNNFDDGSKSLEHYADVMTALGAATASSTDEIAGGLEKFASIAKTIGLSYEYAASALATITSNTRQSEEVVGTALKTIFARIQGLNLGETLEDGTTLNKYSEALQKVGISVFDASGEIKNMDTLLDEMAGKWDNISKAQQIALAQTVAGTRQYTQLVALLDNWNTNDGDSMMANLNTANTATGALQDQADIYAESWEAARDRVTAAAESIYKSLLNDEFFIDVANSIEKIISFVDHLIDNLGGVKGVLTALGAIATKVFSTQISQGLTNMAYNLRMMTEKGRQAEKDARKKVIDDAVNNVSSSTDYTTGVEKAQQKSMQSQLELQQQYMSNVDRMNGVEAEVNKKLMDRVNLLRESVVAAEKRKEAAEKDIDDASYGIISDIASYNKSQQEKDPSYVPVSYNEVYDKNIQPMKELVQLQAEVENKAKNAYNAVRSGSESAKQAVSELNQKVAASSEVSNEVKQIFASLNQASTVDELEAAVRALNQELSKAIGEHSGEIKNVVGPEAAKKVDQYVAAVREKSRAELDSADATRQAQAAQENASNSIMNSTGKQKQWSDILVESANLAFSAATAMSMLGSAFETIMDPDVSGWQKFLTVLTTLGMVIPTLVSLFSTFKSLLSAENVAKLANVAATVAQVAAERALNKEKGISRITTKKNIKETWEDTKTKLRNTGSKIKDKFSGQKNNFNTAAWHKQQGMMQGPGTLEQTQAAGKTAGKALGKMAGSAAIIAAGVAVAIGAVKWGIAQYNKQAEAAKEAAEKAKEAAAAYQSVSSAYNEFSSSVSAYEDAQSGLEGMTKGTLEYREAVLKANEAAMELLNTYDNLQYTVDADGLIIIDEDSLNRAKEAQLETLKNAQRANQLMQQNARTKEIDAKVTQYQRDHIESLGGTGNQVLNALGAGLAGAASGTLVGGGIGGMAGGGVFSVPAAIIGAAVGAITGLVTGVIGSIKAGAAAKSEQEALDRLATVYNKQGNAKFASDEAFRKLLEDELQLDDQALINSLVANRESTLGLVKELAANTAAINSANAAKVQDTYSDKLTQSGLTQEQQTAITNMSGAALTQLTEELYESEYKDKLFGKTDADVQKAYAEAMGWATDTIENQNGNKAKYYDKNGKEIGVISDETARRFLAEQAALKKLEGSTTALIEEFAKLSASTEACDQALLKFLEGGIQGLSKEEFDALYGEVANSHKDDGKLTMEDVQWYLDKQYGDGKDGKISEETAQKYGYKTPEEMYDDYFGQLNGYQSSRDIANDNITQVAQDIMENFNSAVKDSMSISELSSMGQHVNKAFLAHGEEAANFVAETIFGKAGDEAGDLAAAMNNIDWSTINARDLAAQLKGAGVATEFTVEELNLLIDAMNEDVALSVEALAAKMKTLNEISKLQQGDTISAEQYDQLSAGLQSYFTLMADGTYKLTKDALDFYQAVRGEVKNTLEKQVSEQAELVTTATNIVSRGRDYYLQNIGDNQARITTEGVYDRSYADYVTRTVGPNGGIKVNGDTIDIDQSKGYNITDMNDGKYSGSVMWTDDSSGGADKDKRTWGYTQRTLERNADGTYKMENGAYVVTETKGNIIANQDAWLNGGVDLEGSLAWQRNEASKSIYLTNDEATIVRDQLALLGQSEFDPSKLADWNAALEAGTLSLYDANEIYKAVTENMGTFDTLETNAEAERQKLQSYYDQLFMTAESAAEREQMMAQARSDGTPEDIVNASYSNAAQAAINEEKWENLDVAEIEEYSKHLLDIANESELIADNMSEEAAEEVALYTQKMNKGIEKLASSFEDWNDILKKSDKSSDEYAKAMSGMKDAMSDVLGTSEEFIDNDFIIDHLEDIEKAAKGDAEAIDRLKVALAEDILCNILVVSDIDQVSEDLRSLHDQIVGWDANITVGSTLDTGDFLAAANQLVQDAGMTVEQAQAYFNSLGYEPTFKTEPQEVTTTVPEYTTETATYPAGDYTYSYTAPDGTTMTGTVPNYRQVSKTWQSGVSEQTQIMEVPALSGSGTPEITSLTKTSTGAMNNSSGANPGGKSGGGGGGGSKKPAKTPKKSDIVDRYKEVNDLIDDLTDKMNDASKAANRLYGKGRLDLMRKNNELLQQEIELTKKKKEEALKYLDEDRQAMFDAAKDAGVMLNVDSSGLITNYTEAMTELYNDLKDATDQANKDGEVSDAEQEKLDLIQERIDNLKDAIGQYDDTRELLEDLDNDLTEKFYQWQDNNYEILTYELEIKIELNDDEMKLVDYYLSKISDDFYSMAEAAALMVDSTSSMTGASQLDLYNSNLENYANHMAELERAYAAGEISQAAYVEGLREVQEGTLNNLQALNDLDKSMMEYYGNTLAMAGEEIAKYTDRMEHQTSVLDHYQSLMETMGKSTDYKTMGKVLEGKAKTIGDQVAVAKETMKMYQDEADERYLAYQTALASGDQAAAEMYLKQYEDALAAANEAEEEYLNSAEEWAEALRAVLENKLSDLGQTLENALTGGTSFDQMTTSLQRAQSLQEEYLTTTNKIYETNKLMRTAQQEIDKTNNSIAKQRLKSFIQETNQLQNKNKLSQYELQIQQAKYDLLLAEIALDEAQAAKSTVRLQRDNEGNFGYVYTADRAAVSAAEQEMLDKQNSLYNIALDGANDYAQKYQSTLNEMYDTLTDLQQQYLAGAFESEAEYHAAVESAKQYYYEKLQQYSELHTIAVTTDNRVVVEAWSAGFNEMIGSTDTWMVAVNNYVSQVSLAFSTWKGEMEIIAKDVGVDLGSIEGSIKDVTDESDNLRKAIIGEDGKGGVVQALKNELQAVKDVTDKYATLRGSLDSVKQGYEALAAAINAVVAAQSKISNATPPSAPSYTPGTGGGSGNAGDGSGNGNGSGGGGGGGGGGNGGGGGGQTEKSVSITLYAAKNTNARMGTHTVKSNTRISFGTVEYKSENYVNGQQVPMLYASGGGWSGYVTKADRNKVRTAFGFDTGGYTGDWSGSHGKLAFLHQKELVLNQGDTENFLASMQILERILQVIDLQSASSQIGGILSAPRFNMNNTDTLEQNVHIEASFPGITEHNELEQAFNNLVNQAAQYANR